MDFLQPILVMELIHILGLLNGIVEDHSLIQVV
nr:MAG TPA: hypothetical protein [Bacteriophage sp.]